VKIKVNRKRPGRKIIDAPDQIQVYDNDGNYLGVICFGAYNYDNIVRVISDGEPRFRLRYCVGDMEEFKEV